MVSEIGTTSNQRLENQLTELTSRVRELVVGQHQPALAAKVCGICTSMEHPTNMCPTLQETESDQPESVGAIGGYQYGKQSYQSRPLDNQQYGRQPFRARPNQGPYTVMSHKMYILNGPKKGSAKLSPPSEAQAETRPMQGAQSGRSRWNSTSAIRATLGPAQLHVTTWSSLQRKSQQGQNRNCT
ncbi:hypothetical protein CR513_19051, partial [Mucuna pruriens]